MSKNFIRRYFPFFLSLFALFLLFLKLPKVADSLGLAFCSSCQIYSPYIPMLGAAYFSSLGVLILSCRTMPSRNLKVGGVVWAFGLAIFFSWLDQSSCFLCLGAHALHILLWIFWKPTQKGEEKMLGLKTALCFTSFTSMAALFSTLNFTFLVYGLQFKNPLHVLKEGGMITPFVLETIGMGRLSSDSLKNYEGIVLNFVAPGCPHCKEQLPLLSAIADLNQNQSILFVAITPKLDNDLQQLAPILEWAEDQQEHLLEEWSIEGFPTLLLIDSNGRIIKKIAGLPSNFERTLTDSLRSFSKSF